jgi:hypothetical protein
MPLRKGCDLYKGHQKKRVRNRFHKAMQLWFKIQFQKRGSNCLAASHTAPVSLNRNFWQSKSNNASGWGLKTDYIFTTTSQKKSVSTPKSIHLHYITSMWFDVALQLAMWPPLKNRSFYGKGA